MKKDKINVGYKPVKGTDEKYFVTADIRIPESIADMLSLAKMPASALAMFLKLIEDSFWASADVAASVAFVLQMFTRGWRIWCQEQSGARDYVQGLSLEARKDKLAVGLAVQQIIDAVDPLAPAKRTGRPAQPTEIKATPELQAAMQSGNVEQLQALLAAAGLKVNFTSEVKE